MKTIIGYLKYYLHTVDKPTFLLTFLLASLATFINYYFHLQQIIDSFTFLQKILAWYFIFLIAFSAPYLFAQVFTKWKPKNKIFYWLLLLAPLIFSWKLSAPIHLQFSTHNIENIYWNKIFYWPTKMIIVACCLLVLWKLLNEKQPLYGLNSQNISFKPYGLMLVIMLPLIAAASTQQDFQAMYPKLQNVEISSPYPFSIFYKILYELSYGCDFFTIEFFFRGFLILAFAKFAGRHSILPMAFFYGTIHFGKPLFECISSYFGGIILGIITFETKSIYGGLIVHLGIAWLMELGGFLGNHFLNG